MSVVMTTKTAREAKNEDLFIAEFKKASDAAIPIFLIRTREMERCRNTLHQIAIQTEAAFRVWACNKGMLYFPAVRPDDANRGAVDFSRPVSTDATMIDISKALMAVANCEEQNAFFCFYHPHSHFEKPLIHQHLMDVQVKGRERTIRLLMIVPETVKIPPEIEDYVHVMDFRPPSHAELLVAYSDLINTLGDNVKPTFTQDQVDAIVQNGVGMTHLEFETAISMGLVELEGGRGDDDERATPEDYIAVILRHKTEVIKKTDLMELMPPEDMNNVGGFDLLKQWLALRSKAYAEDARQYGIKVPRGMLCVGPPGSGKSLLAKSVSGEFNVPLVKFDIGKVFGKFVGESEGRMRSAIKIIESMAPCVLLVDEIDKGFGGLSGGGSDGGASMRVLGSFLNWMQDRDNERHPVFVVMTANNVVGLPPELMRRGRIDEIFACTFPTPDERAEILRIHLAKRGHSLPKGELTKVAAQTENYVGAELESIVENALLEAFDKKLKGPTGEMLIEQSKNMVPLFKAFADKVNFMMEWAKNNARPASSGIDFSKIAAATETKKPLRNLRLPTTAKPGRGLDG